MYLPKFLYQAGTREEDLQQNDDSTIMVKCCAHNYILSIGQVAGSASRMQGFAGGYAASAEASPQFDLRKVHSRPLTTVAELVMTAPSSLHHVVSAR